MILIHAHTRLHHDTGVTHCLWYMDAHEAVTQHDAMTETFYPNSAKVCTLDV